MPKFEFRLFIAAVVLSAVFVSCTEQVQPGFADTSETKTFTASIEQGVTKTLLTENLDIEWEVNDRIDINGAVYSSIPGAPATSADFVYVNGDEPQPPYKAFYPSYLVNEDGTYSLPSTQTYNAGKFRGPMYAESDVENLTFGNICGILCLSLTGTDAVSRILLTTAGESVCGNFEMTDAHTLCMKETCKSVSLECGEEGVQLDSTKPTNFYFFLPPQTYAPGMEITIIGPEGKQMTKSTSNEVVVEENALYSFDWDVRLLTPEAIHLFGKGNRRWIWDFGENSQCWGNAGKTGAGANFTAGVVDGQWWGVTTPEELYPGQLAHAAGNEETLGRPAASSNAYMEFSANGRMASYGGDGKIICSSTYEVKDFDSSRPSGWELGKLVTEEPAVLWPFSINENGKTVTEFDIMYLDADNMTLVYTKGNGAGSWGEISYWVFKSK